jgi:exodeoxyribonuclease VII small subunit
MAKAKKETQPTFEEIIERLEAIAQKLESGETELEEALELFEEGAKLTKLGAARLDEAEKKLEILRDDDRTEPFDSSAEGGAG